MVLTLKRWKSRTSPGIEASAWIRSRDIKPIHKSGQHAHTQEGPHRPSSRFNNAHKLTRPQIRTSRQMPRPTKLHGDAGWSSPHVQIDIVEMDYKQLYRATHMAH